jgi:hypothetical protein
VAALVLRRPLADRGGAADVGQIPQFDWLPRGFGIDPVQVALLRYALAARNEEERRRR